MHQPLMYGPVPRYARRPDHARPFLGAQARVRGGAMDRGLSGTDALAAARAQFGDVSDVQRELVSIDRRIARRRGWSHELKSWRDDVRWTLRSLRRQPRFAWGVVLTLALGLGANAAMFSFLDRVFWRPPAGVAD